MAKEISASIAPKRTARDHHKSVFAASPFQPNFTWIDCSFYKIIDMKSGLILLLTLISSGMLTAQTDTVTFEEKQVEILKCHYWYLQNQLDLQGYDNSNAALNEELYLAAHYKNKSKQMSTTSGIVFGVGVLNGRMSVLGGFRLKQRSHKTGDRI